MRAPLLCFLIFTVQALTAQWTITSAPNNGVRKDDICFIGPDTGWVAGGADGTILRTYDGGETWQTVYTGPDHLRSIEFATKDVGFSGSVNDTFLRTLNGGDTWQDITDSIPAPSSICGLCAASPDVIYGCGVWFGPAYVIRSTDGGMNWDKANLGSMASALIDVLFLNADTGFASGKAQPPTLGGVILATVDGGDTWSVRHLTGHHDDYIWKLQTPDSVHIYGSVEAVVGTGTRIVRSSDAGATWTTQAVTPLVPYMQVMGFLDTLHGFVGGNQILLETLNGGQSWQSIPLDAGYDRFHRISTTEAFMCGNGVYKYGDASVGLVPSPPARVEWIDVLPNPASDQIRAVVHVHARSQAELIVCSEQGQVLRTVYKGELLAGERTFTIGLEDVAPGSYYMSLRTNQGQSTAVFVKR
jgi:photosystem II stability/assembly factor-like uncharacterized protein